MAINILAPIADLQAQIDSIKDSIRAAIRNLPDNPRIQRLDQQCFVVKSGDLGNNWTPQHHDFRAQYERIIQEVDKLPIAHIPAFFQKVVDEGKIRETGGYYFTFHDDVRNHMKTLIENTEK
jgi:hypothetical protein